LPPFSGKILFITYVGSWAEPFSIAYQDPGTLLPIRYDQQKYPGAPGVSGVSGGANCQQYAYEFLRAFGYQIPDFRSSDLGEDTAHTTAAFSAEPV
jgi:hypothetical protein